MAVVRTHCGKVRPSNQDAFLERPGRYPLYAVADGMGGHRGGNVASAMAVDSLRAIDASLVPDETALSAAVMDANARIWQRQLNDLSLSGMGTTLTALWEAPDFLVLAHVGDSRAYRLRGGVLTQMTLDHSLVGELLRSGAITTEMARNYPYRNIVTRAVGTEASIVCDVLRADRLPGDRWLLCSDGLTEYAGNDQIQRALALSVEEAADTLLAVALNGGGRDNITLIVLEVPA